MAHFVSWVAYTRANQVFVEHATHGCETCRLANSLAELCTDGRQLSARAAGKLARHLAIANGGTPMLKVVGDA